MSKTKLDNLTITELRQYVLEHNNDKEAFYEYVKSEIRSCLEQI